MSENSFLVSFKSLIVSKKLNLLVGAIWLLLLSNIWTPWLGEPNGKKLIPIWTGEVDEYGKTWLIDYRNPFPSIEIFRYSAASIITIMGVLFIFQIFSSKRILGRFEFYKTFFTLGLLLALTGGWYYKKDFDTTKVVDIIKEFIFGFYTGLATDHEQALTAIAISITFWLCIFKWILHFRDGAESS